MISLCWKGGRISIKTPVLSGLNLIWKTVNSGHFPKDWGFKKISGTTRSTTSNQILHPQISYCWGELNSDSPYHLTIPIWSGFLKKCQGSSRLHCSFLQEYQTFEQLHKMTYLEFSCHSCKISTLQVSISSMLKTYPVTDCFCFFLRNGWPNHWKIGREVVPLHSLKLIVCHWKMLVGNTTLLRKFSAYFQGLTPLKSNINYTQKCLKRDTFSKAHHFRYLYYGRFWGPLVVSGRIFIHFFKVTPINFYQNNKLFTIYSWSRFGRPDSHSWCESTQKITRWFDSS